MAGYERVLVLKGFLGVDDFVADRVAHDFAHRMAVEFAHDVGTMCLRRLHAQIERHGYFLAALSFGQQLYDLALAWRQALAMRGRFLRALIALQKPVQDHLRNARGKKRFVPPERFDSRHKIAPRIYLQNISARAGI